MTTQKIQLHTENVKESTSFWYFTFIKEKKKKGINKKQGPKSKLTGKTECQEQKHTRS